MRGEITPERDQRLCGTYHKKECSKVDFLISIDSKIGLPFVMVLGGKAQGPPSASAPRREEWMEDAI